MFKYYILFFKKFFLKSYSYSTNLKVYKKKF